MKSIRDRLNPEQKPKKQLSKKAKQLLLNMAFEANQLDASKPISVYYEMFLDWLRNSYKASSNKSKFLE
jgi:hypothetical protein